MNNIRYIILLVIIMASESCNTIKLNRASKDSTSFPTAIGVIGLKDQGMFEKGFTTTAIPVLKKGIRIHTYINRFEAGDFKRYLKVDPDNQLQIRYIDSLKEKPKFLSLSLVDRVSLRTELEALHNSETIYYLQNQPKTEIITSVRVALSNDVLQEIEDADAVFLVNNSYKQYQLSLIKNGKSVKKIDFSSLVVFDYESSCFCWGEGKRKQVVLSDIIARNANCPKTTYKDARKAREKMEYFKL